MSIRAITRMRDGYLTAWLAIAVVGCLGGGGGGGGGGDGGGTGPGSDGGPVTDGPPGPVDAAPDAAAAPRCLDVAQCPGKVTIAHAWGITNAAPALWTSGYARPGRGHCSWEAPASCHAIVFGGVVSDGTPGPCCEGANCNGPFTGRWHRWIREWWLEGWLPSIGVAPADVRKAYVIYNRNGVPGGPEHREDCEAIGQLQSAIVDAYRNCDSHVIVTTHSNGGVTFLWAWRDTVERALEGPAGAAFDQDRRATCTAKGRLLADGGVPPLFVNGHLMQAAVGDGAILGNSDFFPIYPYDTVGKRYWEPRTAAGALRAVLGVRFYYNHEDVMTYDFDGASTVGRNEVLGWLDGTVDGAPSGAALWESHVGRPPYVALHACGHTSGHSSSMGAENAICGDLIVRMPAGSVAIERDCSSLCNSQQDWHDSAQGPGFCLNPCHRNCFGPTGMTAVAIRDPAVFRDKFPFSFGNRNLDAMGSELGRDGWLDNRRRLDWRELFERQEAWCRTTSLAAPQEPGPEGSAPKFGPLLEGRNDGSGEVPLL